MNHCAIRRQRRNHHLGLCRFKTASGMNHCAMAYIGKLTPMHIRNIVLEKDLIFEPKRRKISKISSRYFQKTPASLDITPKNNFRKCFGKPASRRQVKTFSIINELRRFITQNATFCKKKIFFGINIDEVKSG